MPVSSTELLLRRVALLSNISKQTFFSSFVPLLLPEKLNLKLFLSIELSQILNLNPQHLDFLLVLYSPTLFLLAEVVSLNQLILQIIIHSNKFVDIPLQLPIFLLQLKFSLLIGTGNTLSPMFWVFYCSLIRLCSHSARLLLLWMLVLQSDFELFQQIKWVVDVTSHCFLSWEINKNNDNTYNLSLAAPQNLNSGALR